MEKNRNTKKLFGISILIIMGIWIAYILQMAPSPLLGYLKDYYHIVNNDALLNLSVSIIYPMIIIASIWGGILEQKIGTGNLFVGAMIFIGIGALINYFAANYAIFLIGRALYGVGFGLGIPFIGSAIMRWYTPKQREIMSTINGLFPFVGTVVSFSLIIPIYSLMDNSWQNAMGIWGIAIFVIMILWFLFFREKELIFNIKDDFPESDEKNLYRNLWKRTSIKLLCVTFVADFFCYSYIAVILPTFLMELGHMTEIEAGFWAAVAFPAVGIIGGIIGGIAIAKTGRRKPSMAAGQLLKTLGISVAVLGATTSIWFTIMGIVIFAIGNSMWMPGMYTVPMELKDMNASRVGAAFALISSCGFAAGFISPIIGGWLTNLLMSISGITNSAASHVFGLKWSLFLFGFINLIGFFSILRLEETGPVVKGSKIIDAGPCLE